jgi:acetyltransferase
MIRYTQIDYDREMAFVATRVNDQGYDETLGVVRVIEDLSRTLAEFAIIVRSDLKGQGLGHALPDKVIRYCLSRGTREIVGEVLRENDAMLSLARSFGFKRISCEGGVVELRLVLKP